nr:phosphoribosylformylglycinamidine cyclo-ligase [Gammaproteobacteria bacterium]
RGLFPGSFCKVTADIFGGSLDHCNVIHADGSGTKSILAYLHYKETGDPTVFYGTAQDSIVMNLDDLICVGATDNILISNTINRNARNCPGEVVKALIDGSEAFMQTMRDLGVNLIPGGGETADVGDLTGTVTVDSNAVVRMPRAAVVTNQITPGLSIIGLSAYGQCQYETQINSGIGSNGLTSARHDLLSQYYAEHYPETYDPNTPPELAYCGPYRLADRLPGTDAMTVGAALLSPTRSYAPVVKHLLRELGPNIKGLIHCSGGALTKCLKFGQNVHYIKDQLLAVPPVFDAIQTASQTSDEEMHQVFNMGQRMEVYVAHEHAETVIDTANAFQIDAQVIGRTEGSDYNQLTLTTHAGQTLSYQLTN